MTRTLILVAVAACCTSPRAPSVDRPEVIREQNRDAPRLLLQYAAVATRMLTAIRYLHPADQSASADWMTLYADVLGSAVHLTDSASLLSALQSIAREVAPTAIIYAGARPVQTTRRPEEAKGLVRWRNLGLGPSLPYHSFREGLDPEKDLEFALTAIPKLRETSKCGSVEVTFRARHAGTSGSATVYVSPAGHPDLTVEQNLADSDGETKLRMKVPSDSQYLDIGVIAKERSRAELLSARLRCESGESYSLDAKLESWSPSGDPGFYSVNSSRCGSAACLVVERLPVDDVFDAAHDMIDVNLGEGIHMSLPTAVWTDGTHTLPLVSGGPSRHSEPRTKATDLDVRLAGVAMTWGTLSLFYPYFKDLGIDWNAELQPALADTANASDLVQQSRVLGRLLYHLRDNHSEATHPDITNEAVIPMVVRRFGDRGIVVTRDSRYFPELKVGDEVTALDGLPFVDVFDQASREISAATPGFLEFVTEFTIIRDQVNKRHVIHVRSVDGAEHDMSTTTVPRKEVVTSLGDPHPKTGTALAHGVTYLDLKEMDDAAFDKLTPALAKASAVIMDLRGYMARTAFKALAHFASGPVPGPSLQIPLVRDLGPHKLVDVDSISIPAPLKPHFGARLFILVNGTVGSAAESFLQIVRNGRLGTLVGEPSAGTNGDRNEFKVAGGFTVLFTGTRAVMDDGRVVQGNGFKPDILVHQTVEGIRAGRDELLEAAIKAATGP